MDLKQMFYERRAAAIEYFSVWDTILLKIQWNILANYTVYLKGKSIQNMQPPEP